MAKVKDLLVNGSSRFIGKIYASDQFISQVANGTAPFVVSSSTVVANLNADMTDGLHVHTGRNNEVNKIVRTDANGYIQTGYINTNVGTENLVISRIFYEYNNDGYIRKMSPSSFFSVLENSGNDISITVAGQNRKLTVGYASNADKLDGVHYQNILERINTGYSESGTATGWFRIAETLTTDGNGITFLLAIQRAYYYANNESYLFSISIAYSGGINITQLSGYANTRLITKIRVDWANSQIAYIDLYINASYTNNNYYWYTVGCAKSYTAWTANPTLVGYPYEFTTVQGCKSDRGFTGDIVGNASSATKWATPCTITLTGSVTGSVSIDGSQNVSLATTTNHTHNYAGSSSAGGSANSALTLLYKNEFDTNYGGYAVFQQSAERSDLPHTGWFNTIKMLHNNSSGYFTEIATSFTGEDGMWRRALRGGAQAGWYKILDSGNFNSYALPLSGGTLTGSVMMSGMDTNLIRNIVYDGTSGWARDLIALQVDGVIKFSVGAYGDYTAGASSNGIYYGYIGCNSYNGLNLRISETTLSWGDSPILHSGNYNSYAPTLTGTGATGTWGITATNAENISSIYPQLAASLEADEINVKRKIDWNNWGEYGYYLEAAIDFNWYETHNLFGVIRGSSSDSAGFGWMYSSDGSTYTPIARLSPDGHLYLASSLTISGAISGVTDITASGHAKVNSLKTQYICIECDNSGNTAGRSSEINNYAGPLYIQHNTSNNCFICSGGGNVGIGTTSPSYKLHVVGDIYTTTGFKKEGSSDSYVLLGGGGHKAISDFATASHTHSNYIERLAWWNEGDSHNANDLLSGTTFAYHNHSNCPTTGTIVAFNCINSIGYPLQLQGSYYGEELWFRNRNGDNGTWNAWRYIIHNGNIGSQSVNYASSAGNADTVDNLHASNFVKFYLSPMEDSAPASSAKSWFENTMPSGAGAIVYNVPGSEKTIIAGKSTGSYGHMLQLNYDDKYLRILRYYAGNWRSDDWEKISAGYADSAGNTDTLDGYHAYSFQVISSTTASSVSSLYCGSYSSYHVTTSSSATMTFANTPDSGKECHIIIYNSGSSTITITLPSGYRRNIDSITIASGAFGEVNVLNAAGTIYVRAV